MARREKGPDRKSRRVQLMGTARHLNVSQQILLFRNSSILVLREGNPLLKTN